MKKFKKTISIRFGHRLTMVTNAGPGSNITKYILLVPLSLFSDDRRGANQSCRILIRSVIVSFVQFGLDKIFLNKYYDVFYKLIILLML